MFSGELASRLRDDWPDDFRNPPQGERPITMPHQELVPGGVPASTALPITKPTTAGPAAKEDALKREIEAGFRVIEQYGYTDNRVISIDLALVRSADICVIRNGGHPEDRRQGWDLMEIESQDPEDLDFAIERAKAKFWKLRASAGGRALLYKPSSAKEAWDEDGEAAFASLIEAF
ncbi:conserved hypothetical protein [Thiomonas sp. X19]|uniref:hypothetical protein n=1 Tax=Thiomonas sp. X19 TaxID=1050370 RepID=UPI000B756936|nr:hypothetical protein [Thiomonas sp. X19]SCC94034.1 conserved hypothetical protein [Thiomonas sp. X19]